MCKKGSRGGEYFRSEGGGAFTGEGRREPLSLPLEAFADREKGTVAKAESGIIGVEYGEESAITSILCRFPAGISNDDDYWC